MDVCVLNLCEGLLVFIDFLTVLSMCLNFLVLGLLSLASLF